MWEIQSSWTELPQFWVRAGGRQFSFTAGDDGVTPEDRGVTVEALGPLSFRASIPDIGSCAFLAPRRTLTVHGRSPVNCIAITPDGTEILSGSGDGRLLLTHLDTPPVPLAGPTPNFDVEDCLVDSAHGLFIAASADFRIYAYSSTEYRPSARFEGHTSAVRCLRVAGDRLCSGSRDSSVMFWDIGRAERIGKATLSAPVNRFCIAECGALFAACDARVLAVDARAGTPAASPAYETAGDFTAIDACGAELAAGESGGSVVLWDVRSLGAPLAEWSWYDAPIHDAGYNAGRLWVATNDGVAAQIDVAEKKTLALLGTTAYAPVHRIAFWNQITVWTGDDNGVIFAFEL